MTQAGRAHVAIVGPTATGKSALAMAVARRRPEFEIVAVDSMLVYRGMDIGTAKPTPGERSEVAHHLIDLVEPSEEFTVARFQRAFGPTIEGIEARHHRALLVGGTGLYLRAVIDDLDIPGRYPDVRAELDGEPATDRLYERLVSLDPVAAARIEPGNRRRIVRALEVTTGSGRPFSSFGPGLEEYPPTPYLLVGISLPADVIARRIEDRLRAQVAAGFADEVAALAHHPGGLSRTARQALGYKELLEHVEGRRSLDDAVDVAVRRTRQFARRQRAWFRRDPRIVWLRADDDPMALLPGLLALVDRHQTGPECN